MRPMPRASRFGAVLVVLLVLLSAMPACADTKEIAKQEFTPTTAGRLTVATSLPAPGFWEGATVDQLSGGFEYGIAQALAARFGLTLHVINVPFEQLVNGDLGGADLALAQITSTDERAKLLAFSMPYYEDDAGAVVRAGKKITDLKTAKERRWAVQRGTIQEGLLVDRVRPDEPPLLFDDAPAAVEAVASGNADAALVDLSTALILTHGRPDVATGARFIVDRGFAIALPKRSDNVEVIDAAVHALISDGTLGDLSKRFLNPVFSAKPGSIPVVRIEP